MLLFAATALEKVKAVPPMFWVKVAVVLLAIVVGYFLIQRAARMNKFIIAMIVFVVGGVFFFTWIYERNEPKWMTPIIEPIASSGFFPTKGGYELKQLEEPGQKTTKRAPTK
jgi:TctA family transporter